MSSILVLGGCGYIGSALSRHLVGVGHDVQSVDLEQRGNAGNKHNLCVDYQKLSVNFLDDFQVVILLAAHSTVAACEEDPSGAVDNNLFGPIRLVRKLRGQKFIYASSGSTLSNTDFRSVYDATKAAFDRSVQYFYPGAIGLRLGTVCGPSPNIRGTMINGMVEAGMRQGKVSAVNPKTRRPILGIDDFCSSVEAAIGGAAKPGLHNLCSFNTTVGAAAEDVCEHLSCPMEVSHGPVGYDFEMKAVEWSSQKQTMTNIILGLIREYSHA